MSAADYVPARAPDAQPEIVAATIHPSAILRQRDDSVREAERGAFASDLAVVGQALNTGKRHA